MPNSFSQLGNLKFLDLSYNQLENVSYFHPKIDKPIKISTHAFTGLVNLTELRLSETGLTKVFDGLKFQLS